MRQRKVVRMRSEISSVISFFPSHLSHRINLGKYFTLEGRWVDAKTEKEYWKGHASSPNSPTDSSAPKKTKRSPGLHPRGRPKTEGGEEMELEVDTSERSVSSSSPRRNLSISTRSSPLERCLVIHREPLEQQYQLGERIGNAGGFGYAMHATKKDTGEKRAVKVIHKRKVTVDLEKLRKEASIHGSLIHQNVVRCYEAYENDESLFLVMELCTGGELYDRIAEKKRFSEGEARQTFLQVVQGVKYLHDHKIAHCDLKPDNLLYQDDTDGAPIKIIDFGMANHLKQRQYLSHFTGTSYYIAPEVHSKHYTISCDIWSLGVILFVLIFGFPPFNGNNPKEIHAATKAGFDPTVKKGWGAWFPKARPASEEVCDLIGKLLRKEPEKRLTAGEILQHPWLTQRKNSDRPLEHLMSYLKVYHVEKSLKTELLKALCADEILSPHDLSELEKSFKKLDRKGNGKLTVSELKYALQNFDPQGTAKSSANSLPRMRSEEMVEYLNNLLAAADMDHDGSLGYEDMILAAVHAHLVRKEERLWALFCRLDVDRDGLLSREELAAQLGLENEVAQSMLDEIAAQNQGAIDYSQFLGMWTSHKSKQLWALVSPPVSAEGRTVTLVSSVLTGSGGVRNTPSPQFPSDDNTPLSRSLSVLREEPEERPKPRVTSAFNLVVRNTVPSRPIEPGEPDGFSED
eukprot:g45002.t1